jgi:glutathione S-transferase
MYTVIGHPRSRAMRVIWALEELGQPYRIEAAPPRSEVARAHNISGKIPSLVTPEGTITDSVAIVTFLADRHGGQDGGPDGGLTHPPGSIARARQDALTNWIVAEVDAALWTSSKHSFILPADQRVPAVRPVAEQEFARALDLLARMRGDGPYLTGARFTVPDLLLSHCAGWALAQKWALPGGAFGDYLKAMRLRPAMIRALERSSEVTGTS